MEEELAFRAKPPSYALESDDEGEDYGELDSARPPAAQSGFSAPAPDAAISYSSTFFTKGLNTVFLLGEAAEALAPSIPLQSSPIELLVDGTQVGVVHTISEGNLVLLDASSVPYASQSPLAASLLSTLSPSSTTILSTYHLGSYISPSRSASETPSTLFLQSRSSSPVPETFKPFAPPNLHHGLGAALLSFFHLASIPALLLLAPTTTPASQSFPAARPSSNTEVYQAVRTVSKQLGWAFVNPTETKGTGLSWLEKQRREKRKEFQSGMYL